MRVFQKVNTHSERFFRSQGLSTAQFDVLAQIGATGGMTQQDLADALLVTKGNISQLLSKLEHEGLIKRHHEGRSNCLFLSEKGRELAGRVVPQQELLIAELLQPLTTDEQFELLRLLRKLDQQISV